MKILAIDVGGIRGIFSAQILKNLEKELGYPLANQFDMICGTSAGSIIGAAIACEKPMAEVADLFVHRAEDIFYKQSKLGLIRSFYENDHFQHLLQEYFGQTRLQDIDKPLLMPAVDMSRGQMHVFKSGAPSEQKQTDRKSPSFHLSSYSSTTHEDSGEGPDDVTDFLQDEGGDIQLWDAVLSSCSAPVYFPPNNLEGRYLTTDGGLYANNPSLLGLTEAIHEYGRSLDDVHILSVGTGQQKVTYDVQEHAHPWGLLKWTKFRFGPFAVSPQIVDLAVTLSSESISYQCQILCRDNFLRVNKEMDQVVAIDDLEHTQYLIDEGEDVYEKMKEQMVDFCQNRT